jgi:hypothetical protein
MFWPFTYPDDPLREHRDWTEAYLVQAFTSGNSDGEILFFSSWLWHRHRRLTLLEAIFARGNLSTGQ